MNYPFYIFVDRRFHTHIYIDGHSRAYPFGIFIFMPTGLTVFCDKLELNCLFPKVMHLNYRFEVFDVFLA